MPYFRDIEELERLREGRNYAKEARQEADREAQLERKRRMAKDNAQMLEQIVKEFVDKVATIQPDLFYEQPIVEIDSEVDVEREDRRKLVRLTSMSRIKSLLAGHLADESGALYRGKYEKSDGRPVYTIRPIAYIEWANGCPDVDMREVISDMSEILETGRI